MQNIFANYLLIFAIYSPALPPPVRIASSGKMERRMVDIIVVVKYDLGDVSDLASASA